MQGPKQWSGAQHWIIKNNERKFVRWILYAETHEAARAIVFYTVVQAVHSPSFQVEPERDLRSAV
jgi:hypothetical protein